MDENQKIHDYSFPNAPVMYWFYFSPMIIIFFVFIIVFRHKIFIDKTIVEMYINLLCMFLLSIVLMPILAYIFANSFPAIRVNTDGLEIKLYSPLKTKWIFLQWNEIDQIDEYTNPSIKFFKEKNKWLFIKSKRLPYFYLILSIIYKHTTKRGVMVSPKIKKYEELVDSLSDNYKKH